MRSAPQLRLGLWLAGRGARASSLDTTLRLVVASLAVLLMLVGCALGPTALARSARTADSVVPVASGDTRTAGTLVYSDDDYVDGEHLNLVTFARAGDDEAAFAGVRIPGPGEMVVSPRARRLLDRSAVLHRRYPGRIVGDVPPGLLIGPRAVTVWRGATVEDMPPSSGWLATEEPRPSEDIRNSIPAELGYAYPVLLVGFLVPLLALMGLLAGLGASRRRQRLAALRLVGLSDRTAKVSAAVEDSLHAFVSLGGGWLAFWLLGRVVPTHLPVEGGVWQHDVSVNLPLAFALSAAFPLVTLFVSLSGLRQLSTSPLGIERRSVRERPRRWRIIPLAVGLVILGTEYSGIVGPSSTRSLMLLLAWAFLVVGLAGTLPLLVKATARRRGDRTGSLAGLMAFRRSDAEPVRSSRVAVGLTILVAVSGPLLVFFPLISDGNTEAFRALSARVGNESLITYGRPLPGHEDGWPQVLSSSAVRAGMRVQVLQVRPTHSRGPEAAVLVVDCREVTRTLGVPTTTCERGLVAPSTARSAGAAVVPLGESADGADGEVTPLAGNEFRLPGHPVESDVVRLLDGYTRAGARTLISRTSLPASSLASNTPTLMLVQPRPGLREEARTAVMRSTGATSLTVEEAVAIASHATREYQVLTLIACLLIVCIAGMATLVSVFDWVRASVAERRLLRIGGVPDQVFVRSLLVGTLGPVLLGVVPAAVVTLLVAHGLTGLLTYMDVGLPWRAVAGVGALAVLVTSIATLAVAPRRRDRSATMLTD